MIDGDGCSSTCKIEAPSCPSLFSDYNEDGITNGTDTVMFNWHVLTVGGYDTATCGGDNQQPLDLLPGIPSISGRRINN